MTKRELRRRAAKGIVDVDPVGCAAARAFIALHHPGARLPREEIFAFVANGDTNDETYVVVSEPDKWLSIIGASYLGELGVSVTRFGCLQQAAVSEALDCGIESPLAITFANTTGIFSYAHRGPSKCCRPATRVRALEFWQASLYIDYGAGAA